MPIKTVPWRPSSHFSPFTIVGHTLCAAGPQHPMEKDLERHLEGIEEEKEGKEPKGGEKVLDSQLERALQILKSWDLFQGLSLKK